MESTVPRKSSHTDRVQKLDTLLGEISFSPSAEQRQCKAAFWARLEENPICSPDSVTLAAASQLTGEGQLSRWWSIAGFSDWFANKNEFRERIEYLAGRSLDIAEEIIEDVNANPSARVNMIKLIMEVAQKMPGKGGTKSPGKDPLDGMTPAQLEHELKKALKLVSPTDQGRVSTDEQES